MEQGQMDETSIECIGARSTETSSQSYDVCVQRKRQPACPMDSHIATRSVQLSFQCHDRSVHVDISQGSKSHCIGVPAQGFDLVQYAARLGLGHGVHGS